MKSKIVSLSEKRKEKSLPANITRVKSTKMLRIPILEKFYQIDGEWIYETKGDSTPRKWKDYDHMDFN